MNLLCHSKVAGVTSGPKAESRQKCLRFIRQVMDMPQWQSSIRLRMVPEPENPHDPDAIRVEFEYEQGKYFHLGYIPNSDTICRECNAQFERHPQSGACPECGRKGHLERMGTATRIKSYFGGEVQARVTEVTGGENGQSLGCNIALYAEE